MTEIAAMIAALSRMPLRPSTLVELRGAPTLKPHLQKRGGRWFVNGHDPTGAALRWAVTHD